VVALRGIGFPFRRGPEGFPAPAVDSELIRDSIRQLMGVSPTERPMRPGVGSQALAFLFESTEADLGALVAADTAQLLGRYEPRIQVLAVKVLEADRARGSLVIGVDYAILSTGIAEGVEVVLGGGGPA